MTSNGHIDFRKRTNWRIVNEFSPKADILEVIAFIKEQRIPGELVLSIPGNGGITAIVFREKERVSDAVVPET